MNGMQSTLINYKNGKKPLGMTYDDVAHTADFLKARTSRVPKVGIICGSGLGGLADLIIDAEVFEFKDIPNFPVSTVSGHAGMLIFGELNGKSVVCMKGRVHGYEGYPVWKLTFPVRVMKLLGVDTLIATNAAGGLNTDYEVGDLMVLKDHINLPGLCGNNPLIGPNDERFGPRFPAMSEAYDKGLRMQAEKIGVELGFTFMREGVYIIQTGPCYESVAECKMFKNLGADVTGMSTVPEVIVARHCGMRCFGMSLVTNKCVMEYGVDKKATHDEVLETGQMRSKDMQTLIARLVGEMENE